MSIIGLPARHNPQITALFSSTSFDTPVIATPQLNHFIQGCCTDRLNPRMLFFGGITKAAEILIIGTPLWLGEESSICRVLIERLYAMSGVLNNKGQSIYYGKVGGCVITGNEDGIKHTAMSLGYALNHLGYTTPPQADCGWIGEAGPGLSYGDAKEDGRRVGFDNDFTQRNTTIMTWNCMHLARMLKESGGIPNEGNNREAWNAGEHFGFENPDGG